MNQLTNYCLLLLLLTSSIGADAGNDSSVEEHRVPRVSGRIVKLYTGNRPEPYLCNSEGYKSDPYSCASFYRCVKEKNGKFSVFRYQCAPGTVYDPDLETCNHPRSTRRTECGGIMKPIETTESTLVNEIESNAELPRPLNSVPQTSTKESIIITQPTGSSYQAPTPYRTPSTSTVYYAETNKFNPESYNAMTTDIPWAYNKEKFDSSKTTSFPQVTSSPKNTDICSNDGFTGDTENCRKFYRCVGNQRGGYLRYEFFCSESTVWDEEIQSCNHPWAVKRSKCGRSMSFGNRSETAKRTQLTSTVERLTTQEPTPSTAEYGQKENKATQQQLQISYGSKVTQTQTQISHSDHVRQNQTQINNGDRLNLNKESETKQNQTQIAYGSAVSQTQTQIDYGDKGVQTQLQIDHSKNASQSQTQIHESTSSQTPTSKQDYNQGTNNQCSESGFMGDSNDCKKFYRCVNNGRGTFTKYEYLCGDGTVWDPSIEACNHEWAVKECGGQSHSATQSTSAVQFTTNYADTTTSTTQSTSDTSEPEIDDIDVGYGNQDNKPETTTILSTTFSKTTSNEKPQYETTTEAQKELNNDNECKYSGFMGDANNCKKFYRCVDDGMRGFTRHEFTCGEGTVWDPSIEACNHAWAVKNCGGNGGTTSESSQTTVQSSSETIGETTITSTSPPNDKNTDEPIHMTTSSQLTSSTESNENNVCKSSGFMGDNKNCKKFYRCVDNGDGTYTQYDFNCGEGTVWDSKIEACNHEWAVETCGGSSEFTNKPSSSTTTSRYPTLQDENKENELTTTQEYASSSTTQSLTTTDKTTVLNTDQVCTSSGFYGDNNNCKKFYRCVDNGNGGFDRFEFTCGEGTVWDNSISACNHDWAVKECGASISNTPQSSSESTSESTQSSTETENEQSSQSTTQKSTTKNPTGNEINDENCESEGFFGSLIDCKKFIRCVDNGKGGYTKYDFTCGEGTVWNQEILACDHESDDKTCLNSEPKPTEGGAPQSQSTTSGSQSESTTSSTTTTGSQEADKTDSPATTSNGKCTSEGFFAHPHDCKKFVRCVGNGDGEYTKYEFSCGEGTVWVQEIQACDHDNGDTNCSKQNESTIKPQDNENSFTSESGYTSSTESQTQSKEDDEYHTTQQPSSANSDHCTSEGYFANKNDCRKFYRCVDNGDGRFTKYDFVCGEGTAWDSNIGNCNHINEVASCAENNKEESNTQQTMKEEEISQTTEGTTSTTKRTTTSSTESTEESGSGSETTSNDKCESEGYYGDSKDCKKFYRCVDDGKGGLTKYDFTCGEGTIWDQDITNCNHPQDVANPSCKSGEEGTEGDSQTSSTTSSTTSLSESTSSSSTSDSSTQSSSNCSQDESSKNPDSSKDISCEQAGYYPNPNDCKKFYRCVDWDGDGKRFSVYHFECGEGTIWDPALDTCNHEESVYPPRDCSQSQAQAQNESSSEGTTTQIQEETTTQESTTTEQTTTQESTTSEKTTTEQEPTTTQQSTTIDQTTTQESTTSEQTTTEQTTTTAQTTTQQSTTSEQTTTQQSTTSEQTTTQQSTTSEQTTTQQTITSEQTTSEQSTTQESTTSEQTTSQQTTTQESTTSEQTTQETTTSEQTTEQTTTEQTSEQTESSTTEGTTESSTTESESSSTTEQSSTTEGEQESSTQSSSSEKDCPETEDDQYLFVCPTSFKRHPKYCNMFYQCTEDEDTHEVKIATFKCPNDTIYDESQTQCVEENKSNKKCNGEMARRHRFKRLNRDSKEPITADKENKSCSTVGYYAFEKNIECSGGFMKCERSKSGKIRGYVHQCPDGYLFWTISKRCELAAKVRDCKRSSNDWKGRWNIPVDRKNVAF